ncbi:MAG: S8 family serine peptidase, partial [Clostridiales bacterium]|nr:S8 family serine peptidase [Clostridiales bacterium]
LPVKVIDSSGNGTVLTVKNGIRYALDYGVDIINLSLGLEDNSGTADYFEELFEEALTYGCVITCAAGNSGTDIAFCYPAHSERTIAVSALTSSLDLASYSNSGDAVDFSAPGSSVKSAYFTSSTATKTMSGTSMATAHVTAAVALLKTWDPTLSNDAIEELLEEYSVDLGEEGKDTSFGYGYIYLGDFDVNQEADAQDPGDGSETIDLADIEVSLYKYSYTYNGNAKTPPVTVTYNGTTLTKNTDYTVVYTDNINAGTALVTVTGKGNYTGSVELEFVIVKASPALTVDAEDYSLVPGDSETLAVSYKGEGELTFTSSNDSVAAVSSDGIVTAVGEGTVTITVAIAETDNYESASASLNLAVGYLQISDCTITLSQTEYTYDGTAHTPAVTV